MEEDDLMYVRIEAMKELVTNHTLLDLTQEMVGDFVF